MNRFFFGIAGIAILVLPLTEVTFAAEQKAVFITSALEYKSGTGKERCQEKCHGKSVADLDGLLADGWRVVSSAPKKLVAEDYMYVPCPGCQPHGCVCAGTEYVLRRDTAPPVKVVIPETELDALKKENLRLKGELEDLKRENGKLRECFKTLGAPHGEPPR